MMTLATDAYQKRRSKKYKLKIQFFTNGFFGKRSNTAPGGFFRAKVVSGGPAF
jgi:hypothetical protein